MSRKLTIQQKEDIERICKGRAIAARVLKNGYRVLGAGPGLTFVSDPHPQWAIELPDAVTDTLYALAVSPAVPREEPAAVAPTPPPGAPMT